MINIHHEPTRTRVETTSGFVGDRRTEWVQMWLNSDYVSTRVTRYESSGGWRSHSVHLHTDGNPNANPTAHINDDGTTPPYVVVNLDTHANVFVPIEIAEAIAAALAEKQVAA